MFTKRLKQARKEKGLNQDQVAGHLNMLRQTYSAYETGRSTPDPETLKVLALLFDVSVDYLMNNTDDPTPANKRTRSLTAKDALNIFASESGLSEEDKKDLDNYVELLKFRAKSRAAGEKAAAGASPAAYAN